MSYYDRIKNKAKEIQRQYVFANGEDLAAHLKISVKPISAINSISAPAVLAFEFGEYVIYVGDTYRNYYIMHEIAHYVLKHETDTPTDEFESNLLACMLTAPPKSIIKKKAFSAPLMATEFDIPVDIAKVYFAELNANERSIAWYKPMRITLTVLSVILIYLLGVITSAFSVPSTSMNPPVNNVVQLPPEAEPEPEPTEIGVAITNVGDKYHRESCQSVQRSGGYIIITQSEAERLKREPCGLCRPLD